jgi:hypothetical protein
MDSIQGFSNGPPKQKVSAGTDWRVAFALALLKGVTASRPSPRPGREVAIGEKLLKLLRHDSDCVASAT